MNRLLVSAFLLLCIFYVPALSQAPTLDDVLARARKGVAEFSTSVGVVLGEETCEEKAFETSGEATGASGQGVRVNPRAGGAPTVQPRGVRVDPRGKRRWRATLAIAAAPDPREAGRPWLETRDVFEVDGHAVPGRDGRLSRLFGQPRWSAGDLQAIAKESTQYRLGALDRIVETPALPLLALHSANARRFSFAKAGEEVVQKTRTWKVDYKELTSPTLLALGDNACGSGGTLWIDPVAGRVQRALLLCVDLRRPDVFSSITVTYRTDAALGLVVPTEMIERPEANSGKEWLGGGGKVWVEGKCTYARFVRLEPPPSASPPSALAGR